MALNIKSTEVERLAAEVARIAQESKTEAIRVSLRERLDRLGVRHDNRSRRERLMAVLEHRIWPQVPADVRGTTITKDEEEQILGFGPEGV